MYTIIDLIDKLISIEKNSEEGYTIVSENKELSERVRIIAKVFAKKHRRHADKYADIKRKIDLDVNIEIDFFTYDKAAKLIYEFVKLKRTNVVYSNVKDVVDTALRFQKEGLSLLLSIHGLLIKSHADIGTENYKILSDIIAEEKKHIRELEKLKNESA
ncbi:rubrerythrin family protein [Clostridium fungisolvens]|uniref:DUF2383 domain-containing protein n=1 Tax=Clostridium fungisolvens TaxID=1604897 RepID=A0A6V8SQK6_9CLOT|nr:rubrerythrin family protein [Clostridium fungisolvens]GFP77173.1 hypothetical protein bsdtw1_03287 [Clostridium fungisolvens]